MISNIYLKFGTDCIADRQQWKIWPKTAMGDSVSVFRCPCCSMQENDWTHKSWCCLCQILMDFKNSFTTEKSEIFQMFNLHKKSLTNVWLRCKVKFVVQCVRQFSFRPSVVVYIMQPVKTSSLSPDCAVQKNSWRDRGPVWSGDETHCVGCGSRSTYGEGEYIAHIRWGLRQVTLAFC